MKKVIPLAALGLVLVGGVATFGLWRAGVVKVPAPGPTGPVLIEEALGPVAPRQVGSYAYSADGRHAALVLMADGKETLWLDGTPGKAYDRIAKLQFSLDGAVPVYLGRTENQQSVVIGTHEEPPYDYTPPKPGVYSDLDVENRWAPYCRDAGRYAYVARRGKTVSVVIDGKASPVYDGVSSYWTSSTDPWTGLLPSGDGKRIAYVARKGTQQALVVDGVLGPWCDDLSMEYVYDASTKRSVAPFTVDGAHVVYKGLRKGRWTLFIDGQEKTARMFRPTVVIAETGGVIAYVDSPDDSDETRVVHGDKTYGPYTSGISSLTLSPDGSHCAFGVEPPNHDFFDSREHLVVDGKVGKDLYQGFRELTFSPDGSRLAFFTHEEDGKMSLVVDGERRKMPGPNPSWLTFSPDNRRVAYTTYDAETQACRIVIDGTASKPMPGAVRSLAFTPDSAHLVCTVERYLEKTKRWLWRAVVDGTPEPEFCRIEKPLTLAPVGGRWAYIAARENGTSSVVIDGVMGPSYARVAGGVDFTADGTRTLYLATREVAAAPEPSPEAFTPKGAGQPRKVTQTCVVVDGQEGPWYDEAACAWFSPDGRHVAASVRQGNEWLVLLDGQVMARYDHPRDYALRTLYSPLCFDAQGTLHGFGYRQGTVYRVTVRMP